MADKESGSNALFWAPTAAGAIISGRRIVKNFATGAVSPSAWMQNPGAAGTTARQYANAMAQQAAQAEFDYLGRINEMMMQGTWRRGMSDDVARRAVTEATRVSLLRGAKMPIEEIETITRNMINPRGIPLAGSAVQKDIFSIATHQVQRYGDVPSFYNTMTSFTERGYAPGVFVGEQELKRMYRTAERAGRARTWIKPMGSKTLNPRWYENRLPQRESAQLTKWLTQFKEKDFGVSIKGIEQYPGNIRMAHMSLTVPGVGQGIDITLPLHKTRYRMAGSEYVMNKMFAGLPSNGGQFTSWADHYVQQLNDRLVPGLQEIHARDLPGRDVGRLSKNLIREFNADLNRYMMWTPSSNHPGQNFINKMNAMTVGAPELSELGMRTAKARPDIDRELGVLYKDYGMHPAVSGGEIMSGRVFGGFDPRAMWAYGKDFPIERRPLQFAREFAPSQGALAAMRSSKTMGGFRRDMPFLATKARRALVQSGVVAPQLAVGYAVPTFASGLQTPSARALESVGLAAEEMLMDKGLLRMFETERLTTMNIGMREALGNERIANWIKQASGMPESVVANRPLRLTPGEHVGYEMKTGNPFYAAQVPGVTQELAGVQLMRGQTGEESAQLILRERHTPTDMMKLFGATKVTTRARDKAYMEHVKRATGAQFADNIDAFVGIDELRKNRSLLRQQMSSGLGILASQRLKDIDTTLNELKGARVTGASNVGSIDARLGRLLEATSAEAIPEMRSFLKMPTEGIERMLPDELSMLRKASSWGLDPRLIGGALESTGFLSATELAEAKRIAGGELVHPSGLVLGLATSHVGAYPHTMGGGLLEGGVRGSMEPRGFSQLLQHNWPTKQGNAAQLLAGDIAASMKNFGPEIQEVMNIQRSLMGEATQGLEVLRAGQDTGFTLGKKPYMLDLGMPVKEFGGASQVYVPAADTMTRLGQFRAGTGDVLQSDLAKAYNRLSRTAAATRNLSNENKALASMDLAAKEFRETIMNEAGALMYGRGGSSGDIEGALRGKMLGSRFLAVSSVDTMVAAAEEGVIELSEAAAGSMFDELEQAAANKADREFLRNQRQAFMRGEKITGTVMRHPFIGPYSIQATQVKRWAGATTKEEYRTFIPSNIKRTVVATGVGEIAADISPAIGLAADFDDDRLMVKLIGNQKTSKAMDELLNGKRYATEYNKFIAESHVLKKLAKNQLGANMAPAIEDTEKVMLGSAKLRIGSAETARISDALSEAKLAMSYHRPDVAPRFNVIAEMMEQQIISGKKMTSLEQNIAQDVSEAIRNIGRPGEIEVKSLANITRDMFGKQLEQGIDMEMAGVGKWKMQVDPEELWRQAQNALTLGREKGGVISQYKQLARGKINTERLTINEMQAMLESAAANRADNLANLAMRGLPMTKVGRMTEMARSAVGGINRGIKELGKFSSTWFRPALYGLGLTAGAFMLLGGPKMQEMDAPVPSVRGDTHDMIPMGSRVAGMMLRGIQSQGANMRPEELQVPGETGGEPTAPGMPTPSAYLTSSSPMKFRVMASGSAQYSPSYDSVSNALRPITGKGGRLNITFHDNRRTLTSQNMSEAMEGF